ncbi:hypothetical protein OROMI_026275 [Orobanche minor]
MATYVIQQIVLLGEILITGGLSLAALSRWPEFGSFAMTLMKDGGDSIQIPCDEVIFGYEKIIYVMHTNVLALLKFEMVGKPHLCTEIHDIEEWDTFGCFDPGLTFNLNEGFESYIVKRLREGNDRIYFMPHNSNMHWILSFIWDGDIYILNTLSPPNHFPALEKALTGTVKSFNIQTGKGNKMPKVKHLLGSPKQPGVHECGYMVMRYMEDIIADKEFTFLKKLECDESKQLQYGGSGGGASFGSRLY